MDKGVLLQSFEWYTPNNPHLWRVLRRAAKELKEAGFTALWLPPAYKGAGGVRDAGYGVYDLYDLGEFRVKGSVRTKYGTRREYLNCLKVLRKYGLSVYTDIVLNHKMGADGYETVKAAEVNPQNRLETIGDVKNIRAATKFTFPKRKGKFSDFTWNASNFKGVDYDRKTGRNGIYLFDGKHWDEDVDDENVNYDYLMGADIDVHNPEVKEELIRWGKWYYDRCGMDGFRLDALKHISASFYKEWLEEMRQYAGRELFCVGEYWNGDLSHLERYLDSVDHTMSLFDVPLHFNMYNAASSGWFDMGHILEGTLMKNDSTHAVTFVDNHDTQPTQSLRSFIPSWFKMHAYAIILLRDQGYPCVFAGDYFGIPHSRRAGRKDQIDKLMALRQSGMDGERHDYFDHHDVVGWTFEGADHNGFAVLMTNAAGGEKRMMMGVQNAGYVMTYNHDRVVIDKEGFATFTVADKGLSIYEFTGEKEDLKDTEEPDTPEDEEGGLEQ